MAIKFNKSFQENIICGIPTGMSLVTVFGKDDGVFWKCTCGSDFHHCHFCPCSVCGAYNKSDVDLLFAYARNTR